MAGAAAHGVAALEPPPVEKVARIRAPPLERKLEVEEEPAALNPEAALDGRDQAPPVAKAIALPKAEPPPPAPGIPAPQPAQEMPFLELVRDFKGHTGPVRSVCMTADGKYGFSAGACLDWDRAILQVDPERATAAREDSA